MFRILTVSLLLSFSSLSAQEISSSESFYLNLKALCGKVFEGETRFPEDPEHAFAGKLLRASVKDCRDNQVRIAFDVGEDTSRTWIFTHSEQGLLFKHQHLLKDGTEDSVSQYGGWAASGTPFHQSFPADDFTAQLIPAASTNVWSVTLSDDGKTFEYKLTRHGKPRYEARLKLVE